METKYTHFHDHFFFYILVLVIIIVSIVSYCRFFVSRDYVVGYEGTCDPATGKCFMSCDDDACTKPDYYSEMQKYEPDLYRECGKDITDCEAASVCLPSDRKCSIIYCDKKTNDNDNTCQIPVGEPSDTQSDNQINPINNTSI
jgi:hypothetical protein